MERIAAYLLRGSTESTPIDSVGSWWRHHLEIASRWSAPIDRALACGAAADRIGWAFASGYEAALGALVPDLPRDRMAALCATEKGGAHPRAIQTTLQVRGPGLYVLDGRKRWVTLGPEADLLLVVATTGTDADGKSRLRVARVDRNREGVRAMAMPRTPFVPEVPHGEVLLEQVEVGEDELVAGDGYERVLEPFRTIEDCHVHAAILGYLAASAARLDWPRDVREELLSHVVAVRALALADPSLPEVHIALAGVLRAGQRLLDECSACFARTDPPASERFERDRVLFHVAANARAQRIESAWRKVAGQGSMRLV